MRVRKAKRREIFRCGVGHHWPEALVVEGQDPSNLDGTYCLVCFGARIVGRLAIPRADVIADPFEPVEAEPATAEESRHPSEVQPGYTPGPNDEAVEVPPPNQPQEEPIERAEEVPAQEAEVAGNDSAGDDGEPTAEPAAESGDAEGQGAGEEPAG